MVLIKAPVKGMKDILPEEMALRDYTINLIKDTYKTFGFTPIETPCMEHIENLTSKQGGENESLIFKILKRGEKLSLEGVSSPDDLVDTGLRYDLTVSLCRFYANNMNVLPSPFKALQIGSAWRADQPQKGRFRQFTQCDIDVLGEASMLTEIELITATSTLLAKLGFRDFTVHLNHRQLLLAMAEYAGFPSESIYKVFIILDKMDKIGLDGVASELQQEGFSQECIAEYLLFFQTQPADDLLTATEKKLCDDGGDASRLTAENKAAASKALSELREIMTCIETIKDESSQSGFRLVYDPSLVRGMGYYTGPIWEISLNEFGSSVGGGGRYDNLVGQFTNLNVPACGFSIGFERIIAVLLEQGFRPPVTGQKLAFLAEKGLGDKERNDMLAEAGRLRRSGATVLVTGRNKNSKYQREQLEKEGYTEFQTFYKKDE